uniref:Uncharacterized protein n=1 Tax=Arundo donax TaxID=35708 RepID=A0A0A8ZGM3_ARUDO
MIRVGFGI